MRAYAIYDEIAQCYVSVVGFADDSTAARAFADLVNDEKTIIGQHPSDYVLDFIVDLDDVDSKLVARGLDLVQPKHDPLEDQIDELRREISRLKMALAERKKKEEV